MSGMRGGPGGGMRGPGGGPGPGGPHSSGAPIRKAQNLGPSIKQMFGLIAAHKLKAAAILVLSVVSVILNILGPKKLGDATNLVVAGAIGKNLPANVSLDQIIAGLRAQGKETQANLLSTAPVRPGQGIDFSALTQSLLLVLALYATSALFLWISGYLLAVLVQQAGFELRQSVQAKLDTVPLSYIDKQSRGDLISRVTNDVDNITQSLQQTTSQLVTSVLTVIGILGMMFSISWRLALIALIVLPLAAITTWAIAKSSQPHFKKQWKATGELSTVVEDAFSGHEVAQLYALNEDFSARFSTHNEQLRHAATTAQTRSGSTMPLMRFISNLSYVAVAVAGGIFVTRGYIGIGQVQAFIQYSNQFTQPIAQLGQLINMIQSGAASTERVFEFLAAAEMPNDEEMRVIAAQAITTTATSAAPSISADPSPDASPSVPEAPGPTEAATGAVGENQITTRIGDTIDRIRFENVSFSYVPGKPVINNLTLNVNPGEQIAIVGPTGAGKTTLVNLLMRFYEVDSGRILINGVDIRSIDRDELRRHIGMVLQDTWLFEGSIADNIGFGKPGANLDEIKAAAQATSVDHHVNTLPEGYDTIVSDEGDGISAGEKQLLTIARAFVANSPILVLDEATSSVDTRTEVKVQQAMNRLSHGRTTFVIAHRLSTIRQADWIIVMENGDVTEQGTHGSLLEKQGSYYRLYQAQFAATGPETN